MRIRRPLAALLISLAMFGGGTTTLTGCGSPSTANEGTTDDGAGSENGEEGENTEDTTTENDEDSGDLPDNSDPEPGVEDRNDDQTDPD